MANSLTPEQYNDLGLLRTSTARSAAAARSDAGYGGRYDDGGASQMEERLKYFEDGITFALTGTSQLYGHTLAKLKQEQDPEYQEYLRLQKKFG